MAGFIFVSIIFLRNTYSFNGPQLDTFTTKKQQLDNLLEYSSLLTIINRMQFMFKIVKGKKPNEPNLQSRSIPCNSGLKGFNNFYQLPEI